MENIVHYYLTYTARAVFWTCKRKFDSFILRIVFHWLCLVVFNGILPQMKQKILCLFFFFFSLFSDA